MRNWTSYLKAQNAFQHLEFISKKSELKWKLVDTAELVIEAVSSISKYDRIAVGAQGVNYGRNGAISLIEIATPEDEVFIFDITTLRASAFEAGLRHLLTNLNITKVFYDARTFCDALFHIFSILPTPVLDCQVLYMTLTGACEDDLLFGLIRALQDSLTLNLEFESTYASIKAAADRIANNNPLVWDLRPLRSPLLELAKVQPIPILRLLDSCLNISRFPIAELAEISMRRIQSRIELTSEKNMRLVDWEFPYFNISARRMSCNSLFESRASFLYLLYGCGFASLTPSVPTAIPSTSSNDSGEDEYNTPNSLLRCFCFEYWVRDILQYIDQFRMFEGIDFPNRYGDIRCIHDIDFTEAASLARKFCTIETIAVYGTDCKCLWIKSLGRSGTPIKNSARITFGLFNS